MLDWLIAFIAALVLVGAALLAVRLGFAFVFFL